MPSDEQRPASEERPAELPPGQLYRLAWVFYLLLALAAVVWLGAREGAIPLSLFVRWPSAAVDLGLGLATGLLLVAVWIAARRFLPAARRLEDELRGMLGGIDRGEILALALLSGLAEELFFRGAVQSAFGWLVATVLFTLLHIGPGSSFRLWTLFAGVAGLLFAGLVVWRQSLLAAIVAHVVVNGVNLYHLVNSTSQPIIEAGSEGGSEL